MKARLIKNHYGFEYLLMDENGETIATSENGLAIKNCQAIERGYDLDELAEEHSNEEWDGFEKSISFCSFKAGFQKALEVNADKRFTLKDMADCWNKALTFQEHKETLGEHIQSLKQKEWDVEIIMKDNFESDGIEIVNIPKPKLDANGCLILKRVI